MTDQEIIQKAVQKAIDDGWQGCNLTHSTTDSWSITGTPKLCVNFTTGGNAYYHPNEFIFNHDFARALWGEGLAIEDNSIPSINFADSSTSLLVYEYHLQQMVLAEHPIKYLGEHI